EPIEGVGAGVFQSTLIDDVEEAHLEVPAFLDALEQSGLSKWLRESPSFFGFYFILAMHTIGLSLVVGPHTVIDLRLLGVARDIPLPPLKRLFSLMWVGLALNATSGVLLVLAYPVKTVTNLDFYIKLSLVGLGIWTMLMIKARVFEDANLSEAAMVDRGKVL